MFVAVYRRFATIYRSHPQWASSPRLSTYAA